MSIMELKGLKGLKGLDALLAQSHSTELALKENIYHLAVDSLQPGRYQPRHEVEEGALKELAASIQSQGIILPLIVRRVDEHRYEIIAGERRWRAAKMLGMQTVPAMIRDISDETALAFALIENIQRESLNPIEEAMAFARLKEDFAMTHEAIAERVGRSRSSITNLLRLLGLCDAAKALLRARTLEMGHARALLSLDADAQREVAERIVAHRLSVRETEKLVQHSRNAIFTQNKTKPADDRIPEWEKEFSRLLSSKVKISLNADGSGRVVVYVHSSEEVRGLLGVLKEKCHR